MCSVFRLASAAVVGSAMLLAHGAASAGAVSYYWNQGPKQNLADPAPPALSLQMQQVQSAFLNQITYAGTPYGFESGNFAVGGSSSFSYGSGATAGTASITSGTPSVVGEGTPGLQLAVGRYNMTPGLIETDPFGGPDIQHIGHWIESSSDFSYSFTSPMSAIGFFLTDLGDFTGALTIQLFNDQTLVYDTVGDTSLNLIGGANGNLGFLGLVASSNFNRAVFHISQGGSPDTDFVGFDSFIIGSANGTTPPLPEPGTLALVGLALTGVGLAGRRRAAR